MMPIDKDAALYSSYLAVLNFYLAHIPGGLKLEDFDESQPLIGGKFHTTDRFFDRMCDAASVKLSDKHSCELFLENAWRTARVSNGETIEIFIVKLADKLLAAPPRPSAKVALDWVNRNRV